MGLGSSSWVAVKVWAGTPFPVRTLEWFGVYAHRSVVLLRGSFPLVEVPMGWGGRSLVGMVVVAVWVGVVLELVSSVYSRLLVAAS